MLWLSTNSSVPRWLDSIYIFFTGLITRHALGENVRKIVILLYKHYRKVTQNLICVSL